MVVIGLESMRNLSYNLIFSYVLILLGVYLLLAAGHDEYRGITTKPVSLLTGFHRRGMGHAYLYRIPVHREEDPKLFREYMTGHWIWAVGIESVGWLLYIRKREDDTA
jgi:hypothetical protein